jgi:hypothetical protein
MQQVLKKRSAPGLKRPCGQGLTFRTGGTKWRKAIQFSFKTMKAKVLSRSIRDIKLRLGFAALGAAAVQGLAGGELLAPFRVEAEGKAIETAGGNAAPCICDFDGDGTWDLIVGQFQDRKARIFRNVGSNPAPKFGAGAWFKAGSGDARVPAG